MSDRIPSHPRSAQSVSRDLITDWFTGNFDKGAVIRCELTSGSSVQLEIEPDKVEGYRSTRNPNLFYHRRKARVIRNDEVLVRAQYVGFHLPTASFAYFNDNKEFIDHSSSVVRLIHIETVTPSKA